MTLQTFSALAGTLKFRLALATLVLLLAGIAMTAWQMDRRASRDALAAAERREHLEAQRIASVIGRRVAEMQRALAISAAQIDPDRWSDLARLEAFFELKAVTRSKFANIAAVGSDGGVRLIVDPTGARASQLNIADRPYFQRTIELGEPQVSDPVPGRISSEPVIILTHPVRLDGRVVGMLAASLRLVSRDLVADLAEAQHDTDDSLIVVTDHRGTILAHPLRAMLTRSLGDDPSAGPAFRRWLEQSRPQIGVPGQWSDGEQIVAMGTDELTGWHVWRLVPVADLLAPIRAAQREAVGAAALVGAGLALLLLWWLSWLLRPLSTLQLKARALMSGDDSTPWPQARGEIGQLVETLRHETERRAGLEQAKARVRAQLESVMAAAPVGIAVTRERRFERVSDEMCRLMGYSASQLQGQLAQVIFASNEDYQSLGPLVAASFERGQVYEGDWPLLRGDGRIYWGRLRARPVQPGVPSAGTVWSVDDITEQRDARDRLEHAARHDALTGVLNRDGFERALASLAGAEATAAGEAATASIIMIDLDHFKPINDSAGHAAGDAMLQAVARAIGGQVRASDRIARLGGDEFAVLLPGCDAGRAEAVAEKIRSAIGGLALTWGGSTLRVGASLGVAERPSADVDHADWCAAADAACYAAKRGGRDAVRTAGRAARLHLAAASTG